MSSVDPFAYHDGAYVLGALDPADEDAFEAHLASCADCRARVQDARGAASLLAALDRNAPEVAGHPAPTPPDTLLPGLLRRAARERTRRRWAVAGLAAVAAACLVTLALVLLPRGGSAPAAPAQAFVSLRPSLISATGRVLPRQWGTEIDVHCSYSAGEHYAYRYRLVVVDRGQAQHPAGDWALVPGQSSLDFRAGTSVAIDQISSIEITADNGTPLLQLAR